MDFSTDRQVPHQRRLHIHAEASQDPAGVEWADEQPGGHTVHEGSGIWAEVRDRSCYRSNHEGKKDNRAQHSHRGGVFFGSLWCTDDDNVLDLGGGTVVATIPAGPAADQDLHRVAHR